MKIAGVIFRPLHLFAGKILSIWSRPTVQPDAPAELLGDGEAAIVYVLESGGLADTLALERACREHGLPSPAESFEYCGLKEARRVVILRRVRGFMLRRRSRSGSKRLQRLIEVAEREHEQILLIPVSVYWGRAPQKERSLLKLMFSEHWDVMGRTRKFFATIIHGRNTLLRFSEALPLNSVIDDEPDPAVAIRKVSRILRVHFRQRRIATIGPDRSHRRTLVDEVLSSPSVRRVIESEGADGGRALEKAERKARDYAFEIAADMSPTVIRVFERGLRWLWRRIYDGVEIGHFDAVHEAAKDKELIYVPCHRSHFDYLLLGYILYEEGLQMPHIAAGVNLNMPVVGTILRKGGAFYLRRSFRGNRLYAAVFDAYLQQVLTRGYSIEYFVEGGRSRTGRLLAPKGGMLVMTVHNYIKDPKRPVVFVPFYYGYEKLIEGDSFISELGGAEKKKESLFGLIKSIRSLRENFGKVYVNAGEGIELDPLLDRIHPGWREDKTVNGDRPEWLAGVVDELGSMIMRNINSAAAATPISLLAYVLLATPKQTIGVDELRRQLLLSMDLLRRFRYSPLVTVPEMTPNEIISHGEKLGVISRSSHRMGDVVRMPERTAVLMTYFRNNILHLLAVPASVACCFIQGRQLEHAELQRLIRLIYPFMQKELCLKWGYEDIDDVTTEAIEALLDMQLLTRGKNKKMLVRPPAGSEKAYQLLMLGQSMVPMLQRFYLAIAILARNGSGTLSRVELEALCEQSAERLSMIYGLHSPDFFNKQLFHDYIRKLQDLEVLSRNSDGKLEFDDSITSIGADARLVLGEEIRHSILSLAPAAEGGT